MRELHPVTHACGHRCYYEDEQEGERRREQECPWCPNLSDRVWRGTKIITLKTGSRVHRCADLVEERCGRPWPGESADCLIQVRLASSRGDGWMDALRERILRRVHRDFHPLRFRVSIEAPSEDGKSTFNLVGLGAKRVPQAGIRAMLNDVVRGMGSEGR